MSDPNPADPPNGMIRFTVSVPARPDLPEREVVAPDERTAWAKYLNLCGATNVPQRPKIEKSA